MRRALLALLLAAGASGAALRPGQVQAQVRDPLAGGSRACGYRVLEGSGVTRREGQVVIIDDRFQVTCDDGAIVRADRGTVDQVTRVVTLIGSVYFEDATRSLSSDEATYLANEGVLHATGNVVFSDRVEGTTLAGPQLEYYRATETRPVALVNAMGRPRLTLARRPGEAAADSAAAPPADEAGVSAPAAADTSGMPLTIDADRMTIEGQNDLTAFGNVVIQDDQMRAVADEAEQRGSSETLELRGDAEIHSQEYSLAADVIFATVPGGSIEDVEATGNARMLGEDLNVEAPRMLLFFADDLLQRSVARRDEALAPGVQPLASSPTFRLQADSIDASLPGQRLEVVVAIGDARGEMIDTTRAATADSAALAMADSLPAAAEGAALAPGDTLDGADTAVEPGLAGVPAAPGERPEVAAGGVAARFESGDSVTVLSGARLVATDWITGDTITGYFASVVAPPADSAAAGEAEAGADPDEASAEADLGTGLAGGETAAAGQADTTLVMQRLVAAGNAHSLYHVDPEEGSPAGTRPGINFLSADRIELTFDGGRVQVADAERLHRSVYLDPVPAGAEEAGADEEADDGAAEEGAPPEELPAVGLPPAGAEPEAGDEVESQSAPVPMAVQTRGDER